MISDLYFLKKTKSEIVGSFCIYSISSFIKLNTAISQSFLLKLF